MQSARPKWGLGELLKSVPRTQDAELDLPDELPAITLNDIESEIKILWNDVVHWEAEQERRRSASSTRPADGCATRKSRWSLGCRRWASRAKLWSGVRTMREVHNATHGADLGGGDAGAVAVVHSHASGVRPVTDVPAVHKLKRESLRSMAVRGLGWEDAVAILRTRRHTVHAEQVKRFFLRKEWRQ